LKKALEQCVEELIVEKEKVKALEEDIEY